MHPHGQVAALDVRRADMLHVGVDFNGALFDASAFSGAVAAVVGCANIAIHLDQLGIVHIATERTFNSFEICAVAVAGPR